MVGIAGRAHCLTILNAIWGACKRDPCLHAPLLAGNAEGAAGNAEGAAGDLGACKRDPCLHAPLLAGNAEGAAGDAGGVAGDAEGAAG